MRRTDWGVGIAIGLIVVVVAAVYFYRTSDDRRDLVAVEKFDAAAQVAGRDAARTDAAAKQPLKPAAIGKKRGESDGAKQAAPSNNTAARSERRGPLPNDSDAPRQTPPVMVDPPKIAPGPNDRAATRPAATQAAASEPMKDAAAAPRGFDRIFTQQANTPPLTHSVESGETLSEIAQRYYGDASAWKPILQANPQLKNSASLPLGMKLHIPAAPAASTRPAKQAAPGRDAHPPASSQAAGSAPSTHPAAGQYKVKSGDSLTSIAQHELGSGRRWKEIHDLNKKLIGEDPTWLKVGMVLKMPAKATSQPR